MTAPTPTRHPNLFTISTADPPAVAAAARSGATLAVADADLTARLGLPAPPLPPGQLRDSVRAEAAAAGVPEAAVTAVVAALIDASVSASAIAAMKLPPAATAAATAAGITMADVAAFELPPTVIVGTEEQCEAVLAAAEAATASRPGRAS